MSPRTGPRAHWTPRYVYDRTRLAIEERLDPKAPWLVAEAVHVIGQWLRPDDVVIEWGAGRSTAWFLDLGVQVRSVEHHDGWADRVRSEAGDRPLVLEVCDPEDPAAYAAAHADLTQVDLALVDGIHRHQCTERAMTLVRPGGLLVVDNIERYLPSDTRSPQTIGADEPDPDWAGLAPVLAEWRGWWFSNGVSDTAIWIRP